MFGALMLALILGTHQFWPAHAPIARYDFLVIASVSVQALLLATKLERWDEALVIFIFHVVGTIMEIFKTAHGSWIYPEPSVLRIGAGHPRLHQFLHPPLRARYSPRPLCVFGADLLAHLVCVHARPAPTPHADDHGFGVGVALHLVC